MKAMKPTALVMLTLAGLLLIGGCRRPTNQAISVAPAPSELPPNAEELPPPSAALVGVEGQPRRIVRLPVPAFAPVEPTPEEREILGPEPPEPVLDVLLFYRPQRGPAQGVMPGFRQPIAERYRDAGGPAVGHEAATLSYSNAGSAGHHAEAYPIRRRAAAAGDLRSATAGTAGRAGADVGEGPRRRGAKRASRYDR